MAFDARNKFVYDLFSQALYNVPRNQRRYVWDKRNWQELFDDISFVVEGKYASHFIGSIVLKDGGRTEGLQNYTIIDGQQRIITMTIILASTMFWMKRTEMAAEFEGIKRYLFSTNDVANSKVMVSFEYHGSLEKIIQHIRDLKSDNVSPNAMIDYLAVNKQRDKSITDAFKFFLSIIKENLEHADDKKLYLIKLRDAIVGMAYVSIIANSDEDAYTIFEILNARGQELEDHELLKNYIMRYIQPESNRDSAKAEWNSIELKLGNNIEKFVEHYSTHRYVYERGESEYKTIQKANRGLNTADLLEDIARKADYYCRLIAPDDSPITGNCSDIEYEVYSFFKKKRQVQMRPVLMSLIHKKEQGMLDEKSYHSVLLFLYDFYVCYNMIGEENSNKLTNSITKYAEKIENSFSFELLNEFLLELRKKLPSKEAFLNSFSNIGWTHHRGFYEGAKNKDRVQTVLEVLERFKSPDSDCPCTFTIEHVWPDCEDTQNAIIGNLIPLEDELNRRCNSIEYKPEKEKEYLQKKCAIYAKSRFITARNFAERYKNKEFETSVRCRKMAEEFYDKILKFEVKIKLEQ